MYSRKYGNLTVTLEPSGGLMHGALVMQDRETDSYWSIMTGTVVAGKLAGTKLKEIPVASKMKWKEWVKKYPNTLVLSVNGKEDIPYNPYLDYFKSRKGFRGLQATDTRLPSKAPIFAFQWSERKIAVPFEAFEGGHNFRLGPGELFLYRPKNAELFYSTVAFYSPHGFQREKKGWVEKKTGCLFDTEKGEFISRGQPCQVRPFAGIDTFWYNWSLSNPDTHLLIK